MNPSPPLLFLSLLADRKLNPGAVLLSFGAGDAELLLPQTEEPDFQALMAEFPCLISASTTQQLPAGVLQNLQNAGCQGVDDTALYHFDQPTTPQLPATAQWLSGNWYLTPPAKAAANQAISRALALKLVQLVAADADTREIEDIFRRDPVLSYHLLRLVNSLGAGTSKRITSFAQAILILGRQQLKRWLNLMLFAASKDDHRSAMLLARVGVRARSMELLAKAVGLEQTKQEQAFMAGMFSLLDTLFGLPLSEILQPLQLGEALPGALLRHEGEIGRLLQTVKAAEAADADALRVPLDDIALTSKEFNPINIAAHRWIFGVIQDQRGSAHG